MHVDIHDLQPGDLARRHPDVGARPPRPASDLARLGLEGFFDAVVSSAELGCEKPREAIYRAALERAGVAASEALFVDDQLENVAAAAALGLVGHRFTQPGLLAALLGDRAGST